MERASGVRIFGINKMAAPRLRGLSCRVSDQLYLSLCSRAKAEGTSVSSLTPRILQEAEPPDEAKQVSGSWEGSAKNQDPRLTQIENLEAWIQFLVSYLEEKFNMKPGDVPCPSCGGGLDYFESGSPVVDVNGYTCAECAWRVRY